MINLIFKILIIILFCACVNFIQAQSKFKIGLEGGPGLDFFSSTLTGNEIFAKPLLTGHIGLTVRKSIANRFSIESGFIFKSYIIGFGANRRVLNSFQNSAFTSINLPIRFNYNIPLNNNIILITSLGYQFAYNFQYGDTPVLVASEKIGFPGYDVYFTETRESHLKRIFHLAEIGAGIGFSLSKNVFCNVIIRYNIGFEDLSKQDIEYSINNIPPVFEGTIYNRGNSLLLGIGLFYVL